MKWVKASERLPDNDSYVCIKADGIFFCAKFNSDSGKFILKYHPNIEWLPTQFNIEWLDESAESELQEQVRKLREGLEELLEQYEIVCRNYAKGSGVFIKESGVFIEELVKDLPTYQKAKQLLTETE